MATREALSVVCTHQPEPREGQDRVAKVAERPVRLKTPGNAGRGSAARLAAVLAGESPVGVILSLTP